MTTDPEWLQAARLLRLDFAEPPEALEPEQIARLQHPAPKAWRERADLLKALRLDIEAGTLSALERTRTEDVTEPRTVPDPSAARRTWVRRGLFGEERPPMKTIAVKVGERPVNVHVITRAAFTAWHGLREAKRSEGIRAWLRPLEQAEEAAPAKRKSETQVDRVARRLTDCETRAAAHGEPFDRENMPGTKAEFLDLLHALDAELWSIKTVDSLDRYLSKTGCKWPLNAGKQSSAAPLYARLFPEARIRAPGATSPQRRKS